MLFARDKGRMCNNILQYGHVYAWGREHNRSTMSMRFAYKYQYFRICSTKHHNFLTYVAAKYLAKWGIIPTVSFHEPDEDTAEKVKKMQSARLLMVEGWYVRFYDLFLKYKQEIISLFAFNSDITSKIDGYIDNSSPSDSMRLGVHIRRGDYKTWMNGKYYYADSVYLDYIRQFAEMFPGRKIAVYICGNDPSLDKNYYTSRLKGITVNFPAGNPGEDLCLLSSCDYLIGAPSTFSLVAAMYRDIPLCWMEEAHTHLSAASFGKFDQMFRNIR